MSLYNKACDICKIWRGVALVVGEAVIVVSAFYGAYLLWVWFS